MIEGKVREFLRAMGLEVIHGVNAKGWLTLRCPFAPWLHSNGVDRHPGFGVKPEAHGPSAYSCFACGVSGNFPDMIQRLAYYRQCWPEYRDLYTAAVLEESSVSFEPWEECSQVQKPPEPISEAVFAGVFPPVMQVPEGMDYLRGRGISPETAQLAGLCFDYAEHRILVPIYDRHRRLFGFNGRTVLPESRWPISLTGHSPYRKTKDYYGLRKAWNVMGIHLADPLKPYWVVEGLFAWLKLLEMGARDFVNPVATLGCSLSEHQRDILIQDGTGVYLCYDNDAAGEDGLYGPLTSKGDGSREGGGAIDLLRQHVPTFIPLYPQGKNDPDDLTLDEVRQMFILDFQMV